MQSKKNVIVGSNPETHNRRRVGLAVLAVVIIVAAVGGFLFIRHNNSKPDPIDQAYAAKANSDLASKDYTQYQQQQTLIADGQISLAKYSDAKKTLDNIIANVPSNKIVSETYRSYWSLYNKTGDTANRKKYALLTAQKLTAEGQPIQAAAFEKDGNGK